MKLVLLAGLAVPAPLAAQVCPPAPPAEFAPSVADSGRLYHGAVSLDGRELWFFKKVGSDPHAENTDSSARFWGARDGEPRSR